MTSLLKLPLTVLSGSVHALRHPVQSVSGAVSLGRSLVAAVVTGDGHGAHDPVRITMEDTAQPAGPRKDQGDALDLTPGDLGPDTTPGEAHDAVVTEPSAPTGPGDLEEVPPPTRAPDDEDTEVTTPVGTTGADVGHNPDTTDTDLQQPGTEPLMDPSTTKRVKKEAETLGKAADPDKG